MSARWATGRCRSGKTRYRNRGAAIQGKDVARQRTRRFGFEAPPLFVYRCPICRGWHITSIPQAKKQKGKRDEPHG